jgi:hypothetical protein
MIFSKSCFGQISTNSLARATSSTSGKIDAISFPTLVRLSADIFTVFPAVPNMCKPWVR